MFCQILKKKICILPNFKEENLYFTKILRVKNLYIYTDKISMSGRSVKPTTLSASPCRNYQKSSTTNPATSPISLFDHLQFHHNWSDMVDNQPIPGCPPMVVSPPLPDGMVKITQSQTPPLGWDDVEPRPGYLHHTTS